MIDPRLIAGLAVTALLTVGCSESGDAHSHDHDHADHSHDHDEAHEGEGSADSDESHDEDHDDDEHEGEDHEDEATDELGISVGSTVPDLVLTDASGSEVSLASLHADGPVVVTFYRGGWCPYCNTQLADLQARLPEFTEAGARIVAVSPEKPDETAKTAEKNQTSFMVLSDASLEAARSFGVLFELEEQVQEAYKGYNVFLDQHNASGSWALPHPGTFVLDTNGVVLWKWVETDYSQRADADEIIGFLNSL